MPDLLMPCYECLGDGTLRGYFIHWARLSSHSQQDTLALKRQRQAARWEDQPDAAEERPCHRCAGSGQLRDHEAEALAAQAAAPSRGGMAIYNPTTHQWWPAPYQPTPTPTPKP